MKQWMILILVGSAMFGFCQEEEPKKQPPLSGFLGDFSDLERVDQSRFLLVHRKEEGGVAAYGKVMVAPVLIYFHRDAVGVGVSPDKLKELTDYFHKQIVAQIKKSKQLELVTQPGPDVALLRVAITDVKSAKSKANVAVKVVGTAVGVGLLAPSLDVGNASIEAELRDSQSGERLVVLQDHKKGRRFVNMKGTRKLGDAKGAFKKWAKEFRKSWEYVLE